MMADKLTRLEDIKLETSLIIKKYNQFQLKDDKNLQVLILKLLLRQVGYQELHLMTFQYYLYFWEDNKVVPRGTIQYNINQ